MPRKEKKLITNSNLRKALDFYTIHLDNSDYLLRKEILLRNVDESVLRYKRWYFPKLKFQSFNENRLELKCESKDSNHILTILIEKDKLQVSCSCNTEVKMLCFHAYKAFERLMLFDETEYFQQYQPNGLYELSKSHRKYFTVKRTDSGLRINHKPQLGMVYNLDGKINETALDKILNLPGQSISSTPPQNETTLTYIIAQSFRNRLLPFLLPCIGKLTQSKEAIKGFDNFISGTQKKHDFSLRDEQRTINKICYTMWRLTEKLPGLIIASNNADDDLKNVSSHFVLWQSVLPVLREQKFIFIYFLWRKKELKGRPQRSRVERAYISDKIPTLSFQLIDKGSFYQFRLQIVAGKNELRNFNSDLTFFIKYYQNLYFLSSLRDAAIVEWIRKIGNELTIFKEHFSDFENRFLKPLREYYTIRIVQSNRK